MPPVHPVRHEITQEDHLVVDRAGARGLRDHGATASPLTRISAGNTIELCPVGALTSDIYRFTLAPWDLARSAVRLHRAARPAATFISTFVSASCFA